MPESTANEGNKDFVNFKRVVWHAAFYEICKKIETYSETGCPCEIPGMGQKTLYPFIIMLVADYEEQ